MNELLTSLIQAVDVFSEQQKQEVKEEEERNLREMIKFEQDKAYQASLEIDRWVNSDQNSICSLTRKGFFRFWLFFSSIYMLKLQKNGTHCVTRKTLIFYDIVRGIQRNNQKWSIIQVVFSARRVLYFKVDKGKIKDFNSVNIV